MEKLDDGPTVGVLIGEGPGINAVTRKKKILVRPEQLLQFRMNQAALVPITLKDGHQVPPVPAPAASFEKGQSETGTAKPE